MTEDPRNYWDNIPREIRSDAQETGEADPATPREHGGDDLEIEELEAEAEQDND